MTCQLILTALSYYLLACGNYTSNCNTLYNTTQQSLILCNQKDVKQVLQEMNPVINESYKNITHTEGYTMATTTAASMGVTTTDSPQEEIPYLQHNRSEHPLLRGNKTSVNLTNTTRSNESIPMNQSYHVNMSNLTNASVTNESVLFTIRSENLSTKEQEDHSVHDGLSIGFAVVGLLILVGGVYKCNKMHKPKKKKRKSVSPEPPKNRNSWIAEDKKKLPPPPPLLSTPPPGLPPPPVMKVKDLHKKDSLNMIKQLRHHKQAKQNGVKHLKSQMQKLKVIKNMNKK